MNRLIRQYEQAFYGGAKNEELRGFHSYLRDFRGGAPYPSTEEIVAALKAGKFDGSRLTDDTFIKAWKGYGLHFDSTDAVIDTNILDQFYHDIEQAVKQLFPQVFIQNQVYKFEIALITLINKIESSQVLVPGGISKLKKIKSLVISLNDVDTFAVREFAPTELVTKPATPNPSFAEFKANLLKHRPQFETEPITPYFDVIAQSFVSESEASKMVQLDTTQYEGPSTWPIAAKILVFAPKHVFGQKTFQECQFDRSNIDITRTKLQTDTYTPVHVQGWVVSSQTVLNVNKLLQEGVYMFSVTSLGPKSLINVQTLQEGTFEQPVDQLMKEKHESFGAYPKIMADALYNYSHMWDETVNGYLRHGQGFFDTEDFEEMLEEIEEDFPTYFDTSKEGIMRVTKVLIERLQDGIDMHGDSFPYPIVVYRGLTFKNEWPRWLTIGEKLESKRFLSTSTDRSVAEGFAKDSNGKTGAVMVITVPPNTKFAALSHNSNYDENELLFKAGTVLVNTGKISNREYTFTIENLDQKGYNPCIERTLVQLTPKSSN